MGRIRRSIELAKASWRVLRQDRELVWLPAMGFAVSAIVAALVLIPLALNSDFDSATGESTIGSGGYVLLILLSLALTIIGVFFKGALVSGANERMMGGDPTVGSSIGGALSMFHRLLPWALVTGTVGLILQAIRERTRFVANLIGGAWEIITFLVIPVIMIENVGPFAGVKRSAELFRRTWGENLAAQVGFGLLGFVAIIPPVVVIVGGVALGGILGFLLIAAGVLTVAAVIMTITALGAIFQTALYHHATDHLLLEGFDDRLLQDSFTQK